MRISLSVIIPAVLVTSAFFIFAATHGNPGTIDEADYWNGRTCWEKQEQLLHLLLQKESRHSWRDLDVVSDQKHREGGKGSGLWGGKFKT